MLKLRGYTVRLKKPLELFHPRAIAVGDDRHGSTILARTSTWRDSLVVYPSLDGRPEHQLTVRRRQFAPRCSCKHKEGSDHT